MLTWIVWGLVIAGAGYFLATRSMERASSRNLDRAFARARYNRQAGIMSADRLYK